MSSMRRNAICPATATRTFVAATLLATGLGVAAAGGNVLPGDVELTGMVQRADGRAFGILADIGNTVGSTAWAAVTIGIVAVTAAIFRTWPVVIYLGTLLALRLLATQLKPLFDSPRPTGDLVLIRGIHDGTGYPSGHAVTGATLTLGLAVLAWRLIPSRVVAMCTVWFLVSSGVLIGWARIWSGAHWATDVVGGFAFGAAIVAFGVVVLDRQTR